jgi:hypothetical protein
MLPGILVRASRGFGRARAAYRSGHHHRPRPNEGGPRRRALFVAELLRTKGELLLHEPGDRSISAAERCFSEAIEMAPGARCPVVGTADCPQLCPLAGRTGSTGRCATTPRAGVQQVYGGLRDAGFAFRERNASIAAISSRWIRELKRLVEVAKRGPFMTPARGRGPRVRRSRRRSEELSCEGFFARLTIVAPSCSMQSGSS